MLESNLYQKQLALKVTFLMMIWKRSKPQPTRKSTDKFLIELAIKFGMLGKQAVNLWISTQQNYFDLTAHCRAVGKHLWEFKK